MWCRDEENFCATVPKDGRSYSPMLFAQTVRVLKKINKPGNMIVSFSNLAERIKVSTGENLTYKKDRAGSLCPFPSVYCFISAVELDFWEWSFVQGPGGAAGKILVFKEQGGQIPQSHVCSLVSCRPAAAGRGDIRRCL